MIAHKKFNEDTKIEQIWYESSNLLYSEVDWSKVKSTTINEGDIQLPTRVVNVIIVFKHGARYVYYNVQEHDYIAFRDIVNRADKESHGKAFNKYIKSYKFDKLSDIETPKMEEDERFSKG
jgi:hypothetical protein